MTGLSIKDIVVVGFSGSVLVGTHDMKSIHKSIKSGTWTSAWIWLKYCSIPISYEHNQHLFYPKKIRESKLQFILCLRLVQLKWTELVVNSLKVFRVSDDFSYLVWDTDEFYRFGWLICFFAFMQLLNTVHAEAEGNGHNIFSMRFLKNWNHKIFECTPLAIAVMDKIQLKLEEHRLLLSANKKWTKTANIARKS